MMRQPLKPPVKQADSHDMPAVPQDLAVADPAPLPLVVQQRNARQFGHHLDEIAILPPIAPGSAMNAGNPTAETQSPLQRTSQISVQQTTAPIIQRQIQDKVEDFVRDTVDSKSYEVTEESISRLLIDNGAATADVANDLRAEIKALAKRINDKLQSFSGVILFCGIQLNSDERGGSDDDVKEEEEEETEETEEENTHLQELQEMYQGLTWLAFKKTFRAERYTKDAGHGVSRLEGTEGLVTAFVSNRVQEDGKARIEAAFKWLSQKVSKEGLAQEVLAFAAKNEKVLKGAFLQAYADERRQEIPGDLVEKLQKVELDITNSRFFATAIEKVLAIIKSKDLDVFFDQTGPSGVSGGTPPTESMPASIANNVDIKELYTNREQRKYTLSINLTNVAPDSGSIGTVIFHEVMHIAGGNLGGKGGGGHFNNLDDYEQAETISGQSVPRMLIDAYFMEVVWNMFLSPQGKEESKE